MYMQHKHMLYEELYIYHYLVLYQNVIDNAYSTPLRHEFWNVDYNIVMLGINLCSNTFSHLVVQHQNCPVHDNVCLYILFPLIVFVFYLINETIFALLFFQIVLKCLSWNYIIVMVSSVHLHLEIKYVWSRKFNSVHQFLYIYNAYQHHWFYLQPLCHAQVHLCLNQL